MSMEIYIFSDRQLESITGWQRAIDTAGFPLQLSNAIAFEKVRGVLPVQLGEQPTAFECVHWNAPKMMTELDYIEFDHKWKYMLALRMTGQTSEVIAAYMAASAYAHATAGAIFDCEEGKFISAQRAAEIAREIEFAAPRLQEMIDRAVQASLKK